MLSDERWLFISFPFPDSSIPFFVNTKQKVKYERNRSLFFLCTKDCHRYHQSPFTNVIRCAWRLVWIQFDSVSLLECFNHGSGFGYIWLLLIIVISQFFFFGLFANLIGRMLRECWIGWVEWISLDRFACCEFNANFSNIWNWHFRKISTSFFYKSIFVFVFFFSFYHSSTAMISSKYRCYFQMWKIHIWHSLVIMMMIMIYERTNESELFRFGSLFFFYYY